MAFNKLNWQGNTGGNGATGGPKMHSYQEGVSQATMAASGYFNTVADQIDTGDLVYCFSSSAPSGKIYVATNTANVITTAALV